MLTNTAITSGRSLEIRHVRLSSDSLLPRTTLDHLTTDAVSCAIEQDDLKLAVELLEQGRGTILRQIGGYRTPLDDVAAVDPDLADRFRILSSQLDASIVRGEDIDVRDPTNDSVAR